MVSKAFVLAGRAKLTIQLPDGTHRTYKIVRAKKTGKYWCHLLIAPDTYTFFGGLDVETGAVTGTAFAHRLLSRVLQCIWRGDEAYKPHGYNVYHSGRCGRCGRELTVPASILSGIGPECSKYV